jgi:hypothetical protein
MVGEFFFGWPLIAAILAQIFSAGIWPFATPIWPPNMTTHPATIFLFLHGGVASASL